MRLNHTRRGGPRLAASRGTSCCTDAANLEVVTFTDGHGRLVPAPRQQRVWCSGLQQHGLLSLSHTHTPTHPPTPLPLSFLSSLAKARPLLAPAKVVDLFLLAPARSGPQPGVAIMALQGHDGLEGHHAACMRGVGNRLRRRLSRGGNRLSVSNMAGTNMATTKSRGYTGCLSHESAGNPCSTFRRVKRWKE